MRTARPEPAGGGGGRVQEQSGWRGQGPAGNGTGAKEELSGTDQPAVLQGVGRRRHCVAGARRTWGPTGPDLADGVPGSWDVVTGLPGSVCSGERRPRDEKRGDELE
ncbi:hypothetical protein NDU88_006539 [Pleurodeles waltl]|uniref:Uncharacterized protein n=1 Tax=Pleurodeles waltl TaxID=8319 RepID=A0AAV7QI04_PLEWA|nr:hypothetical protein NDU88_006539 [Pleurodeles waltl]